MHAINLPHHVYATFTNGRACGHFTELHAVDRAARFGYTLPAMPCQQCGRPAMFQYRDGLTLCLDCNEKFQIQNQRILENLERQHNVLLDEMDMVSGIRTVGGRYPPRRPVVVSGDLNHIRIDRSTVGVVNTGSIRSVDIAITAMQQTGDADLAAAIKELTEAIASSRELEPQQQTEALQMVDAVATEAAKPRETRRSAVLRPVLTALADLVKTGAGLAAIWDKVGPVIAAAF